MLWLKCNRQLLFDIVHFPDGQLILVEEVMGYRLAPVLFAADNG